jgi:FkbM family methyltransferase
MPTAPIAAVTLAGQRFRVAGPPGCSYHAELPAHAAALRPLVAVAAAVLPRDGIAFDIGANVGTFACALAALAPAGRVLAVEPSPATAAALRETVALNGLDERVEVRQSAVGAAPGRARFHADAGHSAGSHLLHAGTMAPDRLAPVEVEVTTVDTLAAGFDRLDLIKIDVEGFESEVLDGAVATLARHRPVVLAEFNAWTILCNRYGNPRTVLEDWLARFPFVHALGADSPPARVRPADALAFLHDHLVLRRCADELALSFDDAWVGRWSAG